MERGKSVRTPSIEASRHEAMARLSQELNKRQKAGTGRNFLLHPVVLVSLVVLVVFIVGIVVYKL